MSSSDAPLPSSDAPVYSDRASTPPSSPPTYYNSTATTTAPTIQPSTSTKSAFSLLGKRKVLDEVSDNARPRKRSAKTEKTASSLTQMQLSLGQEVQKRCETCGMEYTASSAEDRKIHDKYHAQNTLGCEVGRDFVAKARPGTVLEGVTQGDTICAVDSRDTLARRRKAKAVLVVVQRALGAVDVVEGGDIWKGESQAPKHFTAYMYIRGTRCVGFLLTEHISAAHLVVKPKEQTTSNKIARAGTMTALEALRARQRAQSQAADQPIEISTSACMAKLGVSRIWVTPTLRHQNIASALLGASLLHYDKQAAEHATESTKTDGLTKEDVAFSQPTEAGTRLARRWFGKLWQWKIYVE